MCSCSIGSIEARLIYLVLVTGVFELILVCRVTLEAIPSLIVLLLLIISLRTDEGLVDVSKLLDRMLGSLKRWMLSSLAIR